MNKVSLLIAMFLFFCLGKLVSAEDEIRSTLDDQQEVAVTIYNEQLALVRL